MNASKKGRVAPSGDNHLEPAKVYVGTFLPKEQHALLKAYAKANHRSVSGQVAHMIEERFGPLASKS